MNFTIDWLQNYVTLEDITPNELADQLTMLGLEVDSVTNLYEDLAPIRTAEIIEAQPHPDADKLQVCKVVSGDLELEIVCGAPNARKGLITALAPVGTLLPGGLKIKKSKVRGVVSYGMLCSEKELGLSEESEGILELPEHIEHGQEFITAMALKDVAIEVDLTPNRADCASVIGVAREVAGFTRKPLKLPVTGSSITKKCDEFSVEIENPELCPRYAGRLIKGVKIGPSPFWLRKRLLSIGLRPINNVVDITNFVLMEYGQPLHAFDFDTLADKKIVVRTPRDTELNFTTLDEKERILDSSMLMICDGSGPVAVAGVMGGMNSEVTDATTNILLESACFNDISIRKTARNLNLSTDSSYRFERGVDPGNTLNGMNRAVELLCEIAGGTCVEGEGIDLYPGKKEINEIPLRVTKCNDLLGIKLNAEEMVELLESVELKCTIYDQDNLLVTPPSFRVDIERAADLYEEVARLYGYNNIPISLPNVDLSYAEQDSSRLLRHETCDLFTRIGFSEAINYSFSTPKHLDMIHLSEDDSRRAQVPLLNPLSEEQSVMRTTIVPGLLENVKRNISFQKTSVKLFEIGKIFIATENDKQPIENTRLGGVISGNIHGESNPLYYKQQAADIFDIKGSVEYFLESLRLMIPGSENIVSIEVPEKNEPFVDDGQFLSLIYDKKIIGYLGKIKNDVVKSFGIKQDVFYFDIDFDAICTLKSQPKSFSSLPVYPSVKRDLALVVPESVSSGELLQSVRDSREKLIEHSEIFDVFRGEQIGEGNKSVALSITYRSPTKTLTEKNVEKVHAKIVKKLSDTFGAQFRES